MVKILLGLEHGDGAKMDKLPLINGTRKTSKCGVKQNLDIGIYITIHHKSKT
jgi:hypothetical protein